MTSTLPRPPTKTPVPKAVTAILSTQVLSFHGHSSLRLQTHQTLDAPEDLTGIQIIFQDAGDGDTDQDEQDGSTTETEQTTCMSGILTLDRSPLLPSSAPPTDSPTLQ